MAWPFGAAKPLGPFGETVARRFLRRAGLKILARNYRCPAGEVDLIALDRATRKNLGAETIVFVEVKTRRSDHYSGPEAAVDARKQDRIRRVADDYLRHHDADGYRVRFDVVAVVAPEGEKPRVRHIVEAF